jgi:periplasmic copper chaperone A
VFGPGGSDTDGHGSGNSPRPVAHYCNVKRVRIARLALAASVSVGAVLAFAGEASAHVTVDPSSAPKGAEITLGFRVPNEEASANTVELQVLFPSRTPILGIDPESTPGWTETIKTEALNPPVTTDDGPVTSYVSEIDWTGGSIPPGHFQEFYILAQDLPSSTNSVMFPAIQTYSNGDVVRWIQTSVAGQPEPAHPAPVLTLTNGTTDASAGTSSSSSSSSTTGLIGLILGAIGAVAGITALGVVRRGRSTPA